MRVQVHAVRPGHPGEGEGGNGQRAEGDLPEPGAGPPLQHHPLDRVRGRHLSPPRETGHDSSGLVVNFVRPEQILYQFWVHFYPPTPTTQGNLHIMQ